MQMPDDATTKYFVDVETGNLVVGRMATGAAFFAIRVDVGPDPAEPHLLVLNPSVDPNYNSPYLFSPDSREFRVFDMGNEWSVDVPADASAIYPGRAIRDDAQAILVRAGGKYFVDLGTEGGLVDTKAGLWVDKIPDRSGAASWNQFSICFDQEHIEGPGPAVYHWPE